MEAKGSRDLKVSLVASVCHCGGKRVKRSQGLSGS